MVETWPAESTPESLLAWLRRSLAPGMTAQQVAALFEGQSAMTDRVNWGGSGRWRAIVSTEEGPRAAFEYDLDDRLIGYGVAPASDAAGGGPDDDFPLILLEQ